MRGQANKAECPTLECDTLLWTNWQTCEVVRCADKLPISCFSTIWVLYFVFCFYRISNEITVLRFDSLTFRNWVKVKHTMDIKRFLFDIGKYSMQTLCSLSSLQCLNHSHIRACDNPSLTCTYFHKLWISVVDFPSLRRNLRLIHCFFKTIRKQNKWK